MRAPSKTTAARAALLARREIVIVKLSALVSVIVIPRRTSVIIGILGRIIVRAGRIGRRRRCERWHRRRRRERRRRTRCRPEAAAAARAALLACCEIVVVVVNRILAIYWIDVIHRRASITICIGGRIVTTANCPAAACTTLLARCEVIVVTASAVGRTAVITTRTSIPKAIIGRIIVHAGRRRRRRRCSRHGRWRRRRRRGRRRDSRRRNRRGRCRNRRRERLAEVAAARAALEARREIFVVVVIRIIANYRIAVIQRRASITIRIGGRIVIHATASVVVATACACATLVARREIVVVR